MRYPSMKPRQLRRLLEKEPIGYAVKRQSGSHCTLGAPGRPDLHWAFHDGDDLPPGLVRNILEKQAKLTVEEIATLLRR